MRKVTTRRRNHPQRMAMIIGAVALSIVAASSAGASSRGVLHASVASATPNLSGQTINIAVGGTPQATDSIDYIVSQILTSWGAKSQVIAQSGDPQAVLLVLAGDAQVTAVGVTSAIDSKLIAFGPAQPKLDYRMVAQPGITSVSQLRGKTYGYSNPHGVEALMLGVVLAHYGVPESSVTRILAGSSSVRVVALLTHRIQVTDVPTEAWLTLKAHGYKSLVTVADVAPQLADSYMLSSSSWLKAHPADAIAVDEAWIKAAQIFENNPSKWKAAAASYTGHTVPAKMISAIYQALHQANIWSPTASSFAFTSAHYNEAEAAKVGAISSDPPMSTWYSSTYWNKAVKLLGIK